MNGNINWTEDELVPASRQGIGATIGRNEQERDRFRVALEARNQEIRLFWQRSNYFLLLNAAIVAGVVAKLDDRAFMLLFSFLGWLVSFLWARAVLGSKFWQERWEYKLHTLESKYDPNADLFDVPEGTQEREVRKSLDRIADKKWPRALVDWFVLKKPSVSRAMIWLAFLFVVWWTVAIGFGIVRAFATDSKGQAPATAGAMQANGWVWTSPQVVVGICNALLAVGTVALAIAAFTNLRAYNRSARDAVRPIVVFRMRWEENRLSYRMVNAGRGPALRLRLRIGEDVPEEIKTKLNDLDSVDDALPPDSGDPNLQIAFGFSGHNENLLKDERLTLTADYEDLWGRKLRTTFREKRHFVEDV